MADEPLPPAPQKRGPKPRPRPKSAHILPVLQIRLDTPPEEQVFPCTTREMAQQLGWYVSEVRSINEILGIYDSIPMVCQADKCHWATMCPSKEDFIFRGYRCPYELRDVFVQFARYVRELGLHPDDHADLCYVADLVRIEIQIKRIDQQLQIGGMFIEKIGGIAQKEGIAFKEKQVNPLLAFQNTLRSSRNTIYGKLMLSRESKANLELKRGQQKQNHLTFMANLRKAVQQEMGEVIDVSATFMPGLSTDEPAALSAPDAATTEAPAEAADIPDFFSLLED